MKIVINITFGAFEVSKALYKELGLEWDGYGFLNNEMFGIKSEDYYAYRTAPELIEAIEKIGVKESTGELSKLKVIKIPDDVEWYIQNYDGNETIHKKHRIWS